MNSNEHRDAYIADLIARVLVLENELAELVRAVGAVVDRHDDRLEALEERFARTVTIETNGLL
jgi:hypothetical protein